MSNTSINVAARTYGDVLKGLITLSREPIEPATVSVAEEARDMLRQLSEDQIPRLFQWLSRIGELVKPTSLLSTAPKPVIAPKVSTAPALNLTDIENATFIFTKATSLDDLKFSACNANLVLSDGQEIPVKLMFNYDSNPNPRFENIEKLIIVPVNRSQLQSLTISGQMNVSRITNQSLRELFSKLNP